MTPESDTPAVDASPELHKRNAVGKAVAVANPTSKALAAPGEDRVDVPDPPLRHAAGDVRQRTDRSVRAEPPPTNPRRTPSSVTSAQQPRRRKADRNPAGDESGSDSGSGGEGSHSKGGDSGVSKGKKKQTALPEARKDLEDLDAARRIRDEEQRLQSIRTSAELRRRMRDIEKQRAEHRRAEVDRKPWLVRACELNVGKYRLDLEARKHLLSSAGISWQAVDGIRTDAGWTAAFGKLAQEVLRKDRQGRQYVNNSLNKCETEAAIRHDPMITTAVRTLEEAVVDRMERLLGLGSESGESRRSNTAKRLRDLIEELYALILLPATNREVKDQTEIRKLAQEMKVRSLSTSGSAILNSMANGVLDIIFGDVIWAVGNDLKEQNHFPEMANIYFCQLLEESWDESRRPEESGYEYAMAEYHEPGYHQAGRQQERYSLSPTYINLSLIHI